MSRGKYLTDEEKRTICAMAERGASARTIAEALDRDPNSMARWLKRWREGTLMKPYARRGEALPPQERAQPWRPGDPKPEWLRR